MFCSLVNELPAWLSAHANLPETLLGYLPHVHIALLLLYSSRIGHYSTILPLHIQTLIRMNILPWVSGSVVNESPARIPAHVNLPATLPVYFPHVNDPLLSAYSSRIGHYSTVLPLRIQDLDSPEYFFLGVWFARERANPHGSQRMPTYRGGCQATFHPSTAHYY